jgi:hypothetical protein
VASRQASSVAFQAPAEKRLARALLESLALRDELDAGQRADAAAHVALDERQDRPQVGRGAGQFAAVHDPAQLLERVAGRRAAASRSAPMTRS